MANKLFTSESVSAGHPDKVADQISDAIVDAYLLQDHNSKVACETLVTTNQVVIAGEIRSSAKVNVEEVVREVINEIGYDKPKYNFDGHTCKIINLLHRQSDDIFRGVERQNEAEQGAGDQGLMFGYACNETDELMPLSLHLSNLLLIELGKLRTSKEFSYLRPDAKSQVTVEYCDDGKPLRIHTIVISTQHDDFIKPENDTPEAQQCADEAMLAKIRQDIEEVLLPRVKGLLPDTLQALFDENLIIHVNPTGKFVIGGPDGDTGLTGRKIIVDTYGGHGAHGGGAFSGKDPSKVDRSAAYAARHIAKNLVAAGVAENVLVQLAYAIGVAQPVSVSVETYGTAKVKRTDAEIARSISENLDLTPNGIITSFKLRNPIYRQTSAYGHFGRMPEVIPVKKGDNTLAVELFTWEKLDLVQKFKELFNL